MSLSHTILCFVRIFSKRNSPKGVKVNKHFFPSLSIVQKWTTEFKRGCKFFKLIDMKEIKNGNNRWKHQEGIEFHLGRPAFQGCMRQLRLGIFKKIFINLRRYWSIFYARKVITSFCQDVRGTIIIDCPTDGKIITSEYYAHLLDLDCKIKNHVSSG